jgi:hypothetical protein
MCIAQSVARLRSRTRTSRNFFRQTTFAVQHQRAKKSGENLSADGHEITMIHLRAEGFPCNRGGNGQALLETQQGAVQVRSWECFRHTCEIAQATNNPMKGKMTMRYKTDRARHRRLDALIYNIRVLDAASDHRGAEGDRLLANLEKELKGLVHEELVAHPEEVTQLPNGNWALNEYITKQKSAVN